LLRLLTADAVMGNDAVLSQAQAWRAYDRLSSDERILFLEEPSTMEANFPSLLSRHAARAKRLGRFLPRGFRRRSRAAPRHV
jgi:hypothetical protein